MREGKNLLFKPFRLDVADERLWRGEAVVRLTNKAFRVLRHLAENPARLVTKDELLDAVWTGTNVSEAAMTVCIRELRQMLEDDSRTPRFIETVRGRGYRFVAKVAVAGRTAAGDPPGDPAGIPSGADFRTHRPVPTSPAPLVGRDEEMARLDRWLASALEGERRIGFVVGEAGIGKTTLVNAFVERAASGEPLWIGHGQCVDQYGAGEAYLPLLEAVGRICRGPAGAQLLPLLRRQAPSWMAQMPGLQGEEERSAAQPAGSGTTQARMLRELAEAVEEITALRPLLLVLEDLHWSDASTLAWLGYMARRREGARLLVLGTYRPVEAIVAAHPLRALVPELFSRGACGELLLDYLPEEAVAAYLAGRCPGGGLLPGLARMLHRRSEGNPLYLVTLVDTLVREGKLTEDPGGWTIPEGVEALAVDVPEDLRRLIEHQLEAVSPEDREVLEAASVAGMVFSAATVAAGVERGAEPVEARCEALARRRQFLRALGPEEWPDGTVAARYRFIHSLHQEVLYDRVPAARRMRWHRRIGIRLEEGRNGRAGEIAAELAEHFVRGRDAPRAVSYLRQAGNNARQRSAYREAAAHLTRGLGILETLPDTAERARQEVDLQSALGLTYMAARGYATPEVGQAFARARQLCARLGDPSLHGRVLGGSWIYYLMRAEFGTARDLAERMLEIGSETRDPAILGSAHHGLGQVLFHTGEFEAARTHLEEAGVLFGRRTSGPADPIQSVQDGRVITTGFLASCLWHLGYPDQALRKARESLVLARELSHPFTLAYALFFVSSLHGYRGEHALVHPLNEEMLALSLEHGFPVFVAGGKLVRILMSLARRNVEPAEGIAQIRESLETYRATGAESGLPMLLAVLAEVQMSVGQVEEANASISGAKAVVVRTGERRYEAMLSHIEGGLLLQQAGRSETPEDRGKKVAQADACFRRAIEVARRQRAKSLELKAVMSLCRLLHGQGRGEEARLRLAEIYGGFTEGFDTTDLSAASALLDELAPGGGRPAPRRKR